MRGTITSNSVVTRRTLALTSFCKIAPAIGVEIMGVTEPMAFMSPVSEPTTRCQVIARRNCRIQTARQQLTFHITQSIRFCTNTTIISGIKIYEKKNRNLQWEGSKCVIFLNICVVIK